ncbi:MAG: hypothetical protein CVV64_03315 [Candidatus Wallbacteria bacterium HGW-Wallbacteria-1]|jgi:putative inorganic carbon (HCO3(-)) transporter|uniref:O-antigen ligase-related domain-containing protein n=1 Tax=Candidatus Wallbacteria bacterium HGW-Wallbacteria-1 TaxID=2013854 RepID=A0A2N1PTS2_9BACT|nr:MAG: hypothetical protein CVV64_03315 [Candidatus Wallbacteria bacterium HGW-Wallbacteria-1]
MRPSSVIKTLDIFIEVLLVLTVLTSPIAFSYDTTKMFMVAKETLNQIFIMSTLVIWVSRMLISRDFKIVSTPLNVPVAIFALIHVLSISKAESTYLALRDFWRFANYFTLFYLVVNNLKRPRRINMVVSIVVLTAAINAIYGMLQAAGIDPLFQVRETGRGKIFGFFGNPNFLAGYLNICLPICVATLFLPKRGYRILGLVATPFVIMGLAVTMTRSAWIAFTISTLFFLALTFRSGTIPWRRIIIGVMGFIGAFVLVWTSVRGFNTRVLSADVSRVSERVLTMGDTRQFNARQRFMMWKMCLLMVRQNPFMGVGIGNFKHVFFGYQEKWFASHLTTVQEPGVGEVISGDRLYDWYKDVAVSPIRAHNEYLQMAAEMGFPGLMVFIWILVIFFRRGFRVLEVITDQHARVLYSGIMASILGVLISSIFSFPFHRPAVVLLFWFLMGVASLPASIFANWNRYSYFQTRQEAELLTLDESHDGRWPWIGLAACTLCALFTVTMVVRLHIANVYMKKGLGYQINAGEYKNLALSNAAAGKFQEAKAYEREGMALYDRALSLFATSLEYDPSFGETHFRLGQTLQAIGRNSEAIAAYHESFKNIQSKYTYFSLGSIYQTQMDYDRAIEWYERLLNIMPSYVEGHFNLGLIYLTQKRETKKALFHWKEVLSPMYYQFVRPSMATKAHFNLAEIYRNMGAFQQAFEHYSEALKLEPGTQHAISNLNDMAEKVFPQD